MKEVTKEEFFGFVGPRDIVTRAEGRSSIFETRSRRVVGKIVYGETYPVKSEYFLAENISDIPVVK